MQATSKKLKRSQKGKLIQRAKKVLPLRAEVQRASRPLGAFSPVMSKRPRAQFYK